MAVWSCQYVTFIRIWSLFCTFFSEQIVASFDFLFSGREGECTSAIIAIVSDHHVRGGGGQD